MKHNLSIQFKSILLRPLEIGDALLLRELRNRNARFFFSDSQISETQQLQWYQNYLAKEGDYMFAVVPAEDPGCFWGAIGIYGIDSAESIAQSGRVIVDREKTGKKGVGTLAIQAAARLTFTQLGIEKLIARILPDNIPSIRAHEKAGYLLAGQDQQSLVYELSKNSISEVII